MGMLFKRCALVLVLFLAACESMPVITIQTKPITPSDQTGAEHQYDERLVQNYSNYLSQWYLSYGGLSGVSAVDELILQSQDAIEANNLKQAKLLLNRAFQISPNSALVMYQMAQLDILYQNVNQAHSKLNRAYYLTNTQDAFMLSHSPLSHALTLQIENTLQALSQKQQIIF
jgi:hypothetical protein